MGVQELVATERGFDKWVGLGSCRKGKGGLEASLSTETEAWAKAGE